EQLGQVVSPRETWVLCPAKGAQQALDCKPSAVHGEGISRSVTINPPRLFHPLHTSSITLLGTELHVTRESTVVSGESALIQSLHREALPFATLVCSRRHPGPDQPA